MLALCNIGQNDENKKTDLEALAEKIKSIGLWDVVIDRESNETFREVFASIDMMNERLMKLLSILVQTKLEFLNQKMGIGKEN